MGAPPNLFLIGPPGVGKTTLGRRLALQAGLIFVDVDQEIVRATGVDIAYIFEREGEAGFRRREALMLQALTARRGVVIATGGGAVLAAENRRLLAARGFVVYLRASVEQLVRRTSGDTRRPLLAQSTDRRATLEALFLHRDPLYHAAAHMVVCTDHRPARGLVGDILAAWQQGHPDGPGVPAWPASAPADPA